MRHVLALDSALCNLCKWTVRNYEDLYPSLDTFRRTLAQDAGACRG